ncbi:UNVERIFIED_CONTAM: hypothetical protein FKN15_000732 [Acipenser sinensis]
MQHKVSRSTTKKHNRTVKMQDKTAHATQRGKSGRGGAVTGTVRPRNGPPRLLPVGTTKT